MLMEVFCFADFAKRVGARRGEFELFLAPGEELTIVLVVKARGGCQTR